MHSVRPIYSGGKISCLQPPQDDVSEREANDRICAAISQESQYDPGHPWHWGLCLHLSLVEVALQDDQECQEERLKQLNFRQRETNFPKVKDLHGLQSQLELHLLCEVQAHGHLRGLPEEISKCVPVL